jgi:hypothetical protein
MHGHGPPSVIFLPSFQRLPQLPAVLRSLFVAVEGLVGCVFTPIFGLRVWPVILKQFQLWGLMPHQSSACCGRRLTSCAKGLPELRYYRSATASSCEFDFRNHFNASDSVDSCSTLVSNFSRSLKSSDSLLSSELDKWLSPNCQLGYLMNLLLVLSQE